jgi:hypothetical protein
MMEETPSERSEEPEQEDEDTRGRRIKAEAEKLSEAVFNRETRDHLVRAATETLLAVDSMIPRDKVPPEVWEHYLAAKRETLLLVRAVIDAQIGLVKDMESKEAPPESGLKQIKLD